MVYNPDNFCNAVQFSGATSDYTRMSPIYNAMGYGYGMNGMGYGGIFNNTDINYTQNADGTNYSFNQKPDRWGLGIGAATSILGSISQIIIANDQAKTIGQQQMFQYQAYMQQSAQIAQQQKKQQSMDSILKLAKFMQTINEQG